LFVLWWAAGVVIVLWTCYEIGGPITVKDVLVGAVVGVIGPLCIIWSLAFVPSCRRFLDRVIIRGRR